MFIPILALIPIIIIAVATAVYLTRLRSEMRTLYKRHILSVNVSPEKVYYREQKQAIEVYWMYPAQLKDSQITPILNQVSSFADPKTGCFTIETLADALWGLSCLCAESIVVITTDITPSNQQPT
jgi:hypothetical protein